MTTKSIIQLLVFALVFTLSIMPRGWGEQDCYREKAKFIEICDLSIRRGSAYMEPHYACCLIVRTYDMVCVCRTMTDEDEKTVDVQHAYFVSRDCHKPVPAGNKCGSWTIPEPPSPPPSMH
ncbi:hypothetical protein SETIT_2G079800v2 [Setaria italica]|uniref:Bifunctional inhibitor/plant lipid transfer protein/seed storage helical domain-containing protein n=1 Tax=Setaria italica TaxID=4555 RepID=K3ZY51_SETIT|nr:hypothetical protein SETIT_2G079800v2 [Setaria italica]